MSDPLAFFTLDGGRYAPTRFARSAWSETMLNGPAVVAALARSLEAGHGDPAFLPSRCTVDLFSPVAFAPLEVGTESVREGNRIRVADADVLQEGRRVARASLVQLRLGDRPPGEVWSSGRPVPVPPPVVDEPLRSGAHPFFGSDAPDGTPVWSTDMGEHQGARRKRYWQHPLDVVAGERATPFQRAVTLSEATSLLANWGSEGIGFINADLTLALSRLPDSEDVGLEADDHLGGAGVSVGTATLYDRRGPFGTGTVVAVSNARRQIDFGSMGLAHSLRRFDDDLAGGVA